MPAPALSVVIPAFNEGARIAATLEALEAYLARQTYAWEIVAIDDGSVDDTPAILRDWAARHPGTRVESIPHAGKGWAVRHGMLAATGEARLMCDADLAMPVEQIALFTARMAEGYDVVVGSRQVRGARRFDEPPVRHLMGRVFNWLVRLLAVRGFEDTQCGFKCFRGSVADRLFPLQRTRGFGFDVEVLYLAALAGLHAVEIPIDWHHKPASKVRHGADSFRMLRDVLLVRWRGMTGAYRGLRPGRALDPGPHAHIRGPQGPEEGAQPGDTGG